MMSPYLEISFRHGRPFATYIHCCAPAAVASSTPLGHGVVLDMASDGVVIGVDLVDPAHVDAAELCRILGQHGVVIPLADLAPLAA
jgi:hypothetical protein